MRRSFIAFLLAASIVAPLLAQERTARDAYVEGWFKETAEADLGGALKLYQECADRAAKSDPELAAKALMRMSKLALARGETDVAKAFADRVATDFAATAAAKEAASAKEAPAKGAASQEVEEARKWLDEILSDDHYPTEQKATSVMRILGIDEVLRIHRARGGSLQYVVKPTDAKALPDAAWSELARSKVDSEVRAAAMQKLAALKPKAIDAELARSVNPADWMVAGAFIDLCLAVGTPEALASGESTMQAGEVAGMLTVERLYWLQHTEGGARLLKAGFERLKATGTLDSVLRNFLSQGKLTSSQFSDGTTGGAEFRAVFPSASAAVRMDVALRLTQQNAAPLEPEVAAMLLADAEPRVRMMAIALQLNSADASTRARSAAALAAEPRPIEVDGLRAPSQFHEVIDVTTGALRELLYAQLMEVNNGPGADALQYGLDHDHVEVIYALFSPRAPRSGELQRGGNGVGYWNGAYNSYLRQSLEAHDPTDLLQRAVAKALALKDEQLAMDALRALNGSFGSRIAVGVADQFAAAAMPRVDLELVSGSTDAFVFLSPDSLRRLATHPLRDVRTPFFRRCIDADLLTSVAANADEEDLKVLLARGLDLQWWSLVLAVFRRAEPTSRTALDAFIACLPNSDEALILACERGTDEDDLGVAALTTVGELEDNTTRGGYSLLPGESPAEAKARVSAARAAAKAAGNPVALLDGVLDGIKISAPLKEALSAEKRRIPGDTTAWLRAAAAVLRDRRADWNRALMDRQANLIVAKTEVLDPVESGKQLAALGAHDVALGLVDRSDQNVRRAGVEALALLGDKAAVLAYANAHPWPREWVRPMLVVGADAELVALARDGKVSPTEILNARESWTHRELVCNLLLDQGVMPEAPGDALTAAVDHLARTKDVERLAQVARLYGSRDAVKALFQLDAIGRILDELPTWPNNPASEAMNELQRRTGIPEGTSVSAQNQETRRELVAQWRAKLGL